MRVDQTDQKVSKGAEKWQRKINVVGGGGRVVVVEGTVHNCSSQMLWMSMSIKNTLTENS